MAHSFSLGNKLKTERKVWLCEEERAEHGRNRSLQQLYVGRVWKTVERTLRGAVPALRQPGHLLLGRATCWVIPDLPRFSGPV